MAENQVKYQVRSTIRLGPSTLKLNYTNQLKVKLTTVCIFILQFHMGAIMLVLNSLFCLQLIISLSDIHLEHHTASGVVLSLASAFFYAAYLVFLRRKVDHEDKMDIPLFFGRQTLLF